VFAVVNLTLIDLPGLTKVAVGNAIIDELVALFLVTVPFFYLTSDTWNILLQRGKQSLLFKILKTWFDLMLTR